jgi:hypothetical protein
MLDGILPEDIFDETPVPEALRPFRLEPMDPRRIEQLRKMTAGEKLAQMAALYNAAIESQKAVLRTRHSDWIEEKVEREARRCIMFART